MCHYSRSIISRVFNNSSDERYQIFYYLPKITSFSEKLVTERDALSSELKELKATVDSKICLLTNNHNAALSAIKTDLTFNHTREVTQCKLRITGCSKRSSFFWRTLYIQIDVVKLKNIGHRSVNTGASFLYSRPKR